MFKLFERQPNWALKQLVQETDQPAVCFFFWPFYFIFALEHSDFGFSQLWCTYIYKCIEGNLLTHYFCCSNSWKRSWMNCVYTIKEAPIKELMSWNLNTRNLSKMQTLNKRFVFSLYFSNFVSPHWKEDREFSFFMVRVNVLSKEVDTWAKITWQQISTNV